MVVIVEDDGKLIWGTHYVSVGLGYPCTGVRIVVAGGRNVMVGEVDDARGWGKVSTSWF